MKKNYIVLVGCLFAAYTAQASSLSIDIERAVTADDKVLSIVTYTVENKDFSVPRVERVASNGSKVICDPYIKSTEHMQGQINVVIGESCQKNEKADLLVPGTIFKTESFLASVIEKDGVTYLVPGQRTETKAFLFDVKKDKQ